MTFIIVCNTDHRPGGVAAGHMLLGSYDDRRSAVDEIERKSDLYPDCDLEPVETS